MIGYFDTSAVVPLVVCEPSSERCAQLWQVCDTRVSSTLIIAEAHAALAQALRMKRLDVAQHRQAASLLDQRLAELDLALPSRAIAESAAKLALEHHLRGYDAIHAATALALKAPDLVAVANDRALLQALGALGIDTVDLNGRTT
jgi:predicted nucleic acid-binding protein